MTQEHFSKEFLLLCALGAFAIFSSTMSKSPTLSLFAKFLKAGPTEIGLIAAASTVVGIFTNVTAGALSDIYGRRILILAATVIFASAPFLYLLVTSPLHLLLVRLFHGFATATLAPVMSATIADMYASRRGEMMSLSSSSQYVGRLLAPLIGGLIMDLSGGPSFTAFQNVYLACGLGGSLALVLALILFLFPGTKSSRINRTGIIENLQGVPRKRGFLSVSSALAALYLSVGPVETFLPLYAQSLGLSGVEIGLLLSTQTAMTLLAGPVFGRLSDRRGRGTLIMLALGLVVLSLLFLSISTWFPILLLVMIIYGSGLTMAMSSIPPTVSEQVPEEAYGTSLGALETIKDVGQTLGPVISGVVLSLSWGYLGAFSVIGVIIAANLGLLRTGLSLEKKSGTGRDKEPGGQSSTETRAVQERKE